METKTPLVRISGDQLSELLLAEQKGDAKVSPVAIIDVRDDDHVGGNIKGSQWVPSREFDGQLPELVEALKPKKTVIFHCALSQERGPTAARKYMAARKKLADAKTGSGVEGKGGEKDGETDGEQEREQEVLVLDGGFVRWQSKHGLDERLTEAYAKDIWQDYPD
ncbi:MAG: hypothetical protein M1824_004998 [Vezdaea acicularis]|nr:MAG: hypothetical protein M1824_004998 [Vezdaea acicularis]